MRKVYLFLVAAEKSLEEERLEITNLVRSMNDRYSTKNIRVRLFKTGEVMACDPENLENSEMVLLVCHEDILDSDLACFHKALEHFQKSEEPRTPRIVTYFKSETENKSQKLGDFLRYLDEDLGHYYTEYQKTDSLKYHILLNLLTLEDSFVVEYKNDSIFVDGHDFGSMSDMTCMLNHKRLQELKKQYEQIVVQFYDAMDLYDDDPNKENDMEYIRLGTLKEQVKQEIQTIETNIFLAMCKCSKAIGSGELSTRSKQAYRLLEVGEYEKADCLLDFQEISIDIEQQLVTLHMVEDTKQQLIFKIRKTINELLQKIETLQLRTDYQDRFLEIEKCYEKAVQSEIEANIECYAGLEYVYFLQEQNEYKRTIPILEKILLLYKKYEKNSLVFLEALNLLGWSCLEMQEINKAKDIYVRAVMEGEKLVKEANKNIQELCVVNSKLVSILASSYNELGVVCSRVAEVKEAKEYYMKSLEIREILLSIYPGVYEPNLANSYGNIGLEFESELDYCTAEGYYLKSVECVKNFIEMKGAQYEKNLVLHYRHLGNLYKILNLPQKAEMILLDALNISARMAALNPEAYQVKLADCYLDLADLYFYVDRDEEAGDMYLKSYELYDKLIERDYDVFLRGIIVILNQIATYCDYMGLTQDAISFFEQTIYYAEDLSKKTGKLYAKDLENLYMHIDELEQAKDFCVMEEYIYPSDEYTLDYIFTYTGGGKAWISKAYEIYQNEDNEILILLPYTGEGCNLQPDDAKLFYDGKKHAILRGTGLPIIVCDYINENIRDGIVSQKEILIAFNNGEGISEDTITAEFMAEVVYLPQIPISRKAEYFIKLDVTE